jgi:hypothetical protein
MAKDTSGTRNRDFAATFLAKAKVDPKGGKTTADLFAKRDDGPPDVEKEDAEEASGVLKQLKQTRQAILDSNQMGFWWPLVFVTQKQADEFVRRARWGKAVVQGQFGVYIDGNQLAKILGIDLTPASIRFRDDEQDRRLIEEVGIIPEKE